MYIKCWGARGSSPVSGKDFIRYGGNTTCVEIRVGEPEQTIMIDFGTGALPMGRELVSRKKLDLDVLLTHTHWDHIAGFPLFPLLYIPGSRLRFFYNPRYQGNPEKLVVKNMMSSPHFPVAIKDLSACFKYSKVGSKFYVGLVKIESIPLSHPNLGLGYRFEHKGKSFVFLTDNELGFRHPGGGSLEDYTEFCRDADLLIHDAQYFNQHEYEQRRCFGHSQVNDVLELVSKARVKSLGLFHHSSDRTDDQIDALIKKLAGSATSFEFDVFAVAQEKVIFL